MHAKRRKNILKDVKGYTYGRKKLIKFAKQSLLKAGAHAFRDRRKKKRTARQTWNIKINAAARLCGLTYGALIDGLKKQKIILNRKMLANLGEHHKEAFAHLTTLLKKST